jgi:hypothetical protein
MSYAIQNLSNVNQSLILNQKLYLIWILNNTSLIITFLTKNWISILSTVNAKNNLESVLFLTRMFFNNGFYKIFKTLLTKWKPFLTVNYTKSVNFWVYKIGSFIIDKKLPVNSVVVWKSNYFYNQYYTNFVISNISIHNKYYRTVLLKFLSLSLLTWQSWSKNYSISYKFMLISKHFHLVRYYNSYFFKMYNF